MEEEGRLFWIKESKCARDYVTARRVGEGLFRLEDGSVVDVMKRGTWAECRPANQQLYDDLTLMPFVSLATVWHNIKERLGGGQGVWIGPRTLLACDACDESEEIARRAVARLHFETDQSIVIRGRLAEEARKRALHDRVLRALLETEQGLSSKVEASHHLIRLLGGADVGTITTLSYDRKNRPVGAQFETFFFGGLRPNLPIASLLEGTNLPLVKSLQEDPTSLFSWLPNEVLHLILDQMLSAFNVRFVEADCNVKAVMRGAGFSDSEIDQICSILEGLLHLRALDSTTLNADSPHFCRVLRVWQMEADELRKAQVEVLGTFVYNQLMRWIVRRLNEGSPETITNRSIRVVNLRGFGEADSTFEALLTQTVDEALQESCNQVRFENERILQHELSLPYIDFGQQTALNILTQGAQSVFAILEEEVIGTTPTTLVQALAKLQKRSPHVVLEEDLQIRHHFGWHRYQIHESWREKLYRLQKEQLPHSRGDVLTILLEDESLDFRAAFAEHFYENEKKRHTRGREMSIQDVTVLTALKHHLGLLRRRLEQSRVSFVNCLSREHLMADMEVLALCEETRANRRCLPYWMPKEAFERRYRRAAVDLKRSKSFVFFDLAAYSSLEGVRARRIQAFYTLCAALIRLKIHVGKDVRMLLFEAM